MTKVNFGDLGKIDRFNIIDELLDRLGYEINKTTEGYQEYSLVEKLGVIAASYEIELDND
jgi:hypothetical protein